MTWRKAPGLGVRLLTIPLLAFFTIEPLKQLTTRYDWRVRPREQMNEFRAKAAAAGVVFTRDLLRQLADVIREEQESVLPAEPSTQDAPVRFDEAALAREIEKARACQARVAERVRPLLNAGQFAQFELFQASQLEVEVGSIRNFNLQEVRPFYRWLVDFYFLLVLPLYCLSACGAMIRDELQSDTLGFLITRPVGRARLFLIKYLCQMIWLQAVIAAHGLLLFAVGFSRQVPGLDALAALFFGAQFLGVFAWGALSALLGLITRRYLILGIVYGFIVELGLGRIPTNINTLSLSRHLQGLLGHNPLLGQIYGWMPQGIGFSIAMLVGATALFLGIAAPLFRFREYHHAAEMQK